MTIGSGAALRRHFHEAAWNEPLVMELGAGGQRGMSVPDAGFGTDDVVGDVLASIPPLLRRTDKPQLPELGQLQVLRHYMRLSQMVLGNNVSNNLGLGTVTMKYNPVIDEYLVRTPKVADIHPAQDPDTVQGLLEILHRFGEFLCEISGMDRFSFQTGGGAQAIFTNALMIRAYHRDRGDEVRRDEIVTTLYSHPADAAAPAALGYKVITLYPGEQGYPPLDALKAALSEHTAGLIIANPEDTGIYNPDIVKWVDLVHEAGGLCAYDQANANGLLGITRARDAGFDMCHFNLHKTFAVPHGSYGGAVGAIGVTSELEEYLPMPVIEFDGTRFHLEGDRPRSVGVVRSFFGNAHNVIKSYAWVMSLGAEGLREAAQVAVLNNNYLAKRVLEIRGAGIAHYPANPTPRIEQLRCTWEQLTRETGVTTEDIRNRMTDFGVQAYWTSHHPWVVPEPFTPEPTESVSKDELDEFSAVLRQISDEAYSNPEVVKTAPHRSTSVRLRADAFDHLATTWRAYQRKVSGALASRPPFGAADGRDVR